MNTNTNPKREELQSKARVLLAQAKYTSPFNQFLIESTIKSSKTSEEELGELCSVLEEHNLRQTEIYKKYKSRIQKSIADYLQKSVNKSKSLE